MPRLIPVVLLAAFLSLLGALALSFPPQQYYPVARIRLPELGDGELIGYPVGSRVACEADRLATRNWVTQVWQGALLLDQMCVRSPAPELAEALSARPVDRPSIQTARGTVLLDSARRPDGLHRSVFSITPAGSPRLQANSDTEASNPAHRCFQIVGGFQLLLLAGLWVLTRNTRSPNKRVNPNHRLKVASALMAGDIWVLLIALTLVTVARETWFAPVADQRISLNPASAGVHALLSLITVLWLGPILQHYSRRRPFWDEFAETTRVLFTLFLLACTLSFLFRLDAARGTLLLAWGAAVILIPLMRRCVRDRLDANDLWLRPALIIGLGPNAAEAAKAIVSERNLGYVITGFLPSGLPGEHTAANAPVLPHPVLSKTALTPDEIVSNIEQMGDPEIVIAVESLSTTEAAALVQTLSMRFTGLHIIPTIRGLPLFSTTLSHFFRHEVLFLTLRNTLHHRGLQIIKRSFDILGASLLVLLLSPGLVAISLCILRTGGSPFYVHRRVGRGGAHFGCLKFRSMRPDADQVLAKLLASDPAARVEWERDFKLKNDPRITSIGRFLRRTSLDELPQLWNVLRGEMSLVGPRPVIDAELPRYGDQLSLYLQVRPGITGLWQVSGRNDTDYSERVALDTWYVQNWSIWYDIIILFQTVDTVLAKRGAY